VRRFVAAGAGRVLITPYVTREGGLDSLRRQIVTYREQVLDKL
jgi:hypothetical protein